MALGKLSAYTGLSFPTCEVEMLMVLGQQCDLGCPKGPSGLRHRVEPGCCNSWGTMLSLPFFIGTVRRCCSEGCLHGDLGR